MEFRMTVFHWRNSGGWSSRNPNRSQNRGRGSGHNLQLIQLGGKFQQTLHNSFLIGLLDIDSRCQILKLFQERLRCLRRAHGLSKL
ncbi:unnamed protein product [Staurois parvus]|uniref:Uncharacterized protein n=1 Tax=Staurois parvus TaxID=386267 RepID=A0ABN9DF54_9NEOB|nr:unnamed protein product [Staurois parvus]